MKTENYIRVTDVNKIINLPFLDIWRRRMGETIVNQIMNEKAEIGKLIHSLFYRINAGLNPRVKRTYPEIAKKAIVNYKKWFEANVESVILAEDTVCNDLYKYQGHPDLIYYSIPLKCIAMVDYKTGVKLPFIGLQMAAYKEAWERKRKEKIKKYFPLFITKEGGIKQGKIYQNHDHNYRIFLNALMITKGIKDIY